MEIDSLTQTLTGGEGRGSFYKENSKNILLYDELNVSYSWSHYFKTFQI